MTEWTDENDAEVVKPPPECSQCQEDEGEMAPCSDCEAILCERCIKGHAKEGCPCPKCFRCCICDREHCGTAPKECRAAYNSEDY